LVGIAINDSIVVLTILQQTHKSEPVDMSDLVNTVAKCTRHVSATTLTTVASFTTLILGGGQFWPPMAVAISGGGIEATGLALVFVPAAFPMVYCPRAESVNSNFVTDRRESSDRQHPELLRLADYWVRLGRTNLETGSLILGWPVELLLGEAFDGIGIAIQER
jgi:predicted RND superfamily exporter protein